MRLPNFKRLKAQTSTAESLRRLEDNAAEFAQALTGEKGVLRSLLGVSGVGRAYALGDVTPPDDWRASTFGSGWQDQGDPNFGGAAFWKAEDGSGVVKARGLADNTGGALFSYIIPFAGGSAYAPAANDGRLFGVTANAGFAELGVLAAGIQYRGGSLSSYISLAELEWVAADKSPLDWPTASQVRVYLGPDFPGEPQTALVRDAVTAAGVHLGPCPAAWSAAREDGQWIVTLRRVSGLVPLVPYTLSLAVSA